MLDSWNQTWASKPATINVVLTCRHVVCWRDFQTPLVDMFRHSLCRPKWPRIRLKLPLKGSVKHRSAQVWLKPKRCESQSDETKMAQGWGVLLQPERWASPTCGPSRSGWAEPQSQIVLWKTPGQQNPRGVWVRSHRFNLRVPWKPTEHPPVAPPGGSLHQRRFNLF